jgi:hypothetical protein
MRQGTMKVTNRIVRWVRFLGLATLSAVTLTFGIQCVRPPADAPPAAANAPATVPVPPADEGPFKLKPEWTGPCARADAVDVNLGQTPESFVRAAYCQIAGAPAPADAIQRWGSRLAQDSRLRRIDVVRAVCIEQRRRCKLKYSDPWQSQPDLSGAPNRHGKRDVGAVFMFFFHCPAATNCEMDWANTHAAGMDQEHPLLGFGGRERGYYVASEPGFWRRELLDAKYAGLQFLLLNTYGPDIAEGKLKPLSDALTSIQEPVKVALFDDTWTWGEPWFGDFWKQKPDLRETERAANTLYEAKWKPFFEQIDRRHWYRFDGRPFIYFYNSGKLEPRNRSAAVLEKMKARFRADFGEEPFVDVDSAYFDDPDMARVADAKYQWFTFQLPKSRSRSTLKGHIIDHAMVKWDAAGRDHPGVAPKPTDLIVKDSHLLKQVLSESQDAELLVLATWNDLGEGTGIHRNYDYFAGGHWLQPDHFMRLIRNSQSGGK